MNLISKIALILILCISTVSFAQAQRGGGRNADPTKSAERLTTMMSDSLALSDAQKEKIGAVNLAHAKEMMKVRQEARENMDGDRSAMRTKMQAMRKEQKTELKKYLTAEQFTKWETIEANRRKNRGERGRRGGKNRRGKKGEKATDEKS